MVQPLVRLRQLSGGHLNGRGSHVSSLIEGTRLELISLIPRIRHVPIATVRRRRIRTLQSAINQKLNTRDPNVITRCCCDRYRRSACDSRVVRWIRDRNSWCSSVTTTAASSEADAVHRACSTRQIVKKSVRRSLQVDWV